MFFQSWPLWEKMTFILAVAISCVFVLGWIKVVWRFRLERKHELFDEEKRLKIQDLKKNGLIIDSQRKHEIPFGVRAIQSGVQVDGIWISNPNTPVPSELTLTSLPGESSDESGKNSSKSPGEPLAKPKSKPKPRARPIGRPEGLGNRRPTEILQEISEGHTFRPTYKPRRSSQLRFSDHGDYDKETLDQLQGTASPKKKNHTLRSRTSQNVHDDADSSAADNERNSGTSDDSDATLSQDHTIAVDQSGQNILKVPSDTFGSRLSGGTLPKLDALSSEALTPGSQNYAAYDNKSKVDYFSSQPESTHENEVFLSNRAQSPQGHSTPPFVPGELHLNKMTRKINSGFEVLPAGTFGAPTEFNTQIKANHVAEIPRDKKPTAKLQKKSRNLSSGQSSTLKNP